MLSKRFTTGAAYVDAVEAQANAQREAAATRILTQVNAMTGALSMSMRSLSSVADAQQKKTSSSEQMPERLPKR